MKRNWANGDALMWFAAAGWCSPEFWLQPTFLNEEEEPKPRKWDGKVSGDTHVNGPLVFNCLQHEHTVCNPQIMKTKRVPQVLILELGMCVCVHECVCACVCASVWVSRIRRSPGYLSGISAMREMKHLESAVTHDIQRTKDHWDLTVSSVLDLCKTKCHTPFG